MKKKLISAILCAALAITSIASVSAANTASGAGAKTDYKIVKTLELPSRVVGFYKFGDNLSSDATVTLYLPDVSPRIIVSEQDFSFPNDGFSFLYKTPESTDVCDYSVYGAFIDDTVDFTVSEGVYEKVRLKLSDFSDVFNSDGTATVDFNCGCGPQTFDFTKGENGNSSALIFRSGGFFSAVVPDENGYVELYLSTRFGEKTYFFERYDHHYVKKHNIGIIEEKKQLNGFTIGDVNKDGEIRLADAILTQKQSVGMTKLDSLAKRNADADQDGKVLLKDSLKIQKYAIGI